MKAETDTQARILKILQSAPAGAQTEEIADRLGLTRHTVAKYLEVLRAEGKIHFHKVGRSKLWQEITAATAIRLLTAEDIDAILQIEEKIEAKRGVRNGERADSLRETAAYHLQQGDPLVNLGAEADGRLVGFILGEIRPWEFGRGEKTGWIKVLGVDPDFQDKGIGRKLGETLLTHFQRKKVRKVRTLVDWYEGELISYFRSLGFDILNMIPLEKEL